MKKYISLDLEDILVLSLILFIMLIIITLINSATAKDKLKQDILNRCHYSSEITSACVEKIVKTFNEIEEK